jgi:hypothetical protein
MIDSLIHSLVLKARAATGANEEFLAWIFVGAVLSVIAIVFFSLAGYIWLAGLYGAAFAALMVGGIHLALVAILAARCVVVRHNNRQLARAQIELAAKQPGFKIDPRYVAMGIDIVKTVGVRNLIPFVAAGLVAAGWSASRKTAATPPH